MNSNQNSSAYNNFLKIPKFPHKIMEYLISSKSESAESIWKILKYNDVDCLSKPNLTIAEKNDLRYLSKGLQDGKKIFLKPTINDSLSDAENQTIMKIYRVRLQPDTHLIATVDFEIDFFTNETTNLVIYDECYVEKTDLFEVLFLDLFNGKDIGIGSSFLEFNRQKSRLAQSQLNLGNNKSFYGRALVMSLTHSDVQTGSECG